MSRRGLQRALRHEPRLLQHPENPFEPLGAAEELPAVLPGVATIGVVRLILAHLDLGFAAHPAVKTADAGPAEGTGAVTLVEVDDRPSDRLDAKVEPQNVRLAANFGKHAPPPFFMLDNLRSDVYAFA